MLDLDALAQLDAVLCGAERPAPQPRPAPKPAARAAARCPHLKALETEPA